VKQNPNKSRKYNGILIGKNETKGTFSETHTDGMIILKWIKRNGL